MRQKRSRRTMWTIAQALLLAVMVSESVLADDKRPTTEVKSADKGDADAVIDNDVNGTSQSPPLPSRPVATPAAPDDVRPLATTATPADFHVGDGADFLLVKEGHVCLRVVLRASFSVAFVSDTKHPKSPPTSTVDLPKQAFHGFGNCGQNRAHMVIVWGEKRYTLTLGVRRFPDLVNTTDGHFKNVTMWAVTHIEFKFDTSDVRTFTTPLKPAVRTVTSAPHQNYFATPVNFSYSCRSRHEISLQENGVNSSAIESVTMSVWGVRIQALVDASHREPDVVHCNADLASELGRTSLAPTITAACLAVVVIIIIVAYSCVKQKNKMYYRAVD